MKAAIRLEEIKDELKRRVKALAQDVLPGRDAYNSGGYRIGRNPNRADRHSGSFWIRIQDPAAGAWKDEAAPELTGDVIDLVGYWKGCWKDRSATRAECMKWLGWGDGSGGARPLTAAEIAERDRLRAAEQAREALDEEQRRADNRRRAFGLWLHADKLDARSFAGSLPDRYLRGRGIDLVGGWIDRGRPLPGALRFFPAHDYRTADGELIALPCLIALMTGPDGKPRGIHRTWLAPDGSGKAELPEPKLNKPRKIWPAGWQGGVVRIAKGAGELTPEEAARRGRTAPLVVTEGIEDALAVMLSVPDRRVWAAGTLGNIANVPVLPCVSQITVAADNDWDKPQAQRSLQGGLAQIRARAGKLAVPVYEARAPARFKDMNDLLKGART